MPITLAKPAIDVGLMTNDLDPNVALLTELGVAYDHLLKIGGGVHQHRFECGDSVVKLNSHRGSLEPAPTGYVALRLAAGVEAIRTAESVDGVAITAVPAVGDGPHCVEVTWRTADRGSAHRFLVDGFAATNDGNRYTIGESHLVVEHDPAQPRTGDLDALGFRYLTVQVTDVEAAHAHILGLGFAEGRPPVRLGDTAYISFVRDADGNWIELSQRASLTGPLPDVALATAPDASQVSSIAWPSNSPHSSAIFSGCSCSGRRRSFESALGPVPWGRTSAARAAELIERGIARGRRRVRVGRDAVALDLMSRAFPNTMQRLARLAADRTSV